MSFDINRSTEILQRTPGGLRALLGGVGEFWVMNGYGPDTFSPFDVVGHLIHAERTNWLPRARLILQRGESEAFGPFDRYAMYETSRGQSMDDLLATFAQARAKSLDELRNLNLTPQQLAARGTHPDFGAVTLEQLLAAWVVHDLNHLAQIAKGMAYQYHGAVGPWRACLSILPKP